MSPPGYAYVWEFDVRPEKVTEFERVYGPDGDWAALFRRAQGYVGSLLLKDRSVAHRYITIDRWRSEADHEEFLKQLGEEYRSLDARCEEMTVRERQVGAYDEHRNTSNYSGRPTS